MSKNRWIRPNWALLTQTLHSTTSDMGLHSVYSSLSVQTLRINKVHLFHKIRQIPKPCHDNQDTGKQWGFDQPTQRLFWSSIHLTVSDDLAVVKNLKNRSTCTSSPSDHGLYYSLIYSKVSNDHLSSEDPSRLQKCKAFLCLYCPHTP